MAEPLILPIGTILGVSDIAFDDASMPTGLWATTVVTPRGCWQDVREDRTAQYRETVVCRLLRVMWQDVFAAVPTCANVRCYSPSHVFVVMRTALSSHPKEVQRG